MSEFPRKRYGRSSRRSPLTAKSSLGTSSSDIGNAPSLNELMEVRFSTMLFAPLLVVACGTTASRVTTEFIKRIVESLKELPDCIEFLMIDGASPESNMDASRHVVLDVAGCGTDPNRGREVFERSWDPIFRRVIKSISRLSSASPLINVAYPRQEACDVLIIGGSGGASGGFSIPAISLVGDALAHHRVREPRGHYLQLGADMPMRDVNRDPQQEQKTVVPDTCYNNLVKIYGDFGDDAVVRETRPNGTSRMIRLCDQVYSVSVMDQSNGSIQLATTDDMIDMVASSLFFRYLTPCTKYLADRTRDHNELGGSGRGSKQRGVNSFSEPVN